VGAVYSLRLLNSYDLDSISKGGSFAGRFSCLQEPQFSSAQSRQRAAIICLLLLLLLLLLLRNFSNLTEPSSSFLYFSLFQSILFLSFFLLFSSYFRLSFLCSSQFILLLTFFFSSPVNSPCFPLSFSQFTSTIKKTCANSRPSAWIPPFNLIFFFPPRPFKSCSIANSASIQCNTSLSYSY
jgi:hypothetical protein